MWKDGTKVWKQCGGVCVPLDSVCDGTCDADQCVMDGKCVALLEDGKIARGVCDRACTSVNYKEAANCSDCE